MKRPEKIEWEPCPCGKCNLQNPANLGTFYVGNGFRPHEVEWLNEAWAALQKAAPQVD